MHGLNSSFKTDPVAFMRKYAIVSPELRANPPEKEIEDFDLQKPKGADGFVELRLFGKRGKEPGHNSHRIPAFYLKWKERGTENIDLKTKPEYFFTASLEGCRVVIAGTHIMHIDGGTRQVIHELKMGKTQKVFTKVGTANIVAGDAVSEAAGQEWRDGEQAANLKPGDPPPAKLSTAAYGQYGFMAGYFKDGAWKFVAQRIVYDEKTENYKSNGVAELVGGEFVF